MKEIAIWEHILRRALYTCDWIFSLSPKYFLRKIHPYKKLLDQQICENLLSSYINPDSESSDNNILLPRKVSTNLKLGTKIDSLNIISIISRWINNVDYNNKFSYLRELYLIPSVRI
uniref:Uncharacterized protein n=1 Tax=Rhizophagus irregularis (strain DAOM 181602 / DAOM 197198 / MUCL 43194) TaxID=747089 RepID=U9U7Y2_RHIID